MRVQGSGFRIQGSGFRVQGLGFRIEGSGFRVQGLGFCFFWGGTFSPQDRIIELLEFVRSFKRPLGGSGKCPCNGDDRTVGNLTNLRSVSR